MIDRIPVPSASRWVTAAAGVGLAVVWAILAFADPDGAPAAAGPPFWVVWATFTALGLTAAAGALAHAPLVALVAGIVSLVPVGLYFLVLPGLFRWIGLLDVLLVVAAGTLWLRVRSDG